VSGELLVDERRGRVPASTWDHWRPVVFGSEDAREGATASVEKRRPRWQGR
jgi:hypothetical protein